MRIYGAATMAPTDQVDIGETELQSKMKTLEPVDAD